MRSMKLGQGLIHVAFAFAVVAGALPSDGKLASAQVPTAPRTLSELAPSGIVLPPAGTRVRIRTTSSSTPQTGTVAHAPGDSLRLLVAASPWTEYSFARSDLTSVEVSTGMHDTKGAFARYGALIGFVGGAVRGPMTVRFCPHEPSFPTCDGDDPTRLGSAIGFGIVFGVLGAGVGAIAGHFHHAEGWLSVPAR